MPLFYPIITISCLLLNFTHSKSQVLYQHFGAQNTGMGSSTTASTDFRGAYENIARIASAENNYITTGYYNHYQIAELASVYFGATYGQSDVKASLTIQKTGTSLLNQQLVSFGLAHRFGFGQIGIQGNFLQIKAGHYGSLGALSFDLGGIFKLSQKVDFGLSIKNINQATLKSDPPETLLFLMSIGIAYHPVEHLLFTADLHANNRGNNFRFNSGIEYLLREKFFLRAGVQTRPFVHYFGFGIILKAFSIDVAATIHQFLGLSTELTLSYSF